MCSPRFQSILCAGLAIAALAALPAHGAPAEPYGLDAITAFDRLPYLKTDTLGGQASSFQRNGGNKDGENNWLYVDGSERVLCELQGPGVIYRMWFTGYEPTDCTFKVYFDGESTPRLNLSSLGDMQTGATAPFIRPLIRDWLESSGGHPSYVPLLFNKSIKIVSESATHTKLFYNIGYDLFSPDTTVQTWTGAEDRSAANAAWDPSKMTLDPKSTTGNVTTGGTTNLAAGATTTILDVDGPRSLSSIKISFGGGTPSESVLNNTWLKIYWDNESTPSVNAPLGSFFAIGEYGVGIAPKSLMVGLDSSNRLYCYFPMPFVNHAKVQLYNALGSATNNVTYEIQHKPFTDSFVDVGYFKTQYNLTTPSTAGTDLTFLYVQGAGHLVGVVQSESGPYNRINLEGDERFYIDGSRTPAYQGTGTEDFYNGGWYFNSPINGGRITWPMWGYTQHLAGDYFGTPDRSSMYRLFLQDAIPFRGSILAGIEHGGANEVQVDSWTLAYYYLTDSKLALSDTVDVGDATSESAHSYAVSGASSIVSLTNTFEGDMDNVSVTEDGRTVSTQSAFTLTISPNNSGVILRRMLDQNAFNQKANIYVDGTLVGAFLTAGGNVSHRWKEADFMIPGSLTEGKSSITVTVEPVSAGWNEYTYRAYSVLTPLAITTNGGNDYTEFVAQTTMQGICTAAVQDILLNGVSIGHTPGQTQWSTQVSLAPGANQLAFTTLDSRGVESNPETLLVTFDTSLDPDQDGLPTDWEEANGTNPLVADATQDPDHDGLTNEQEYEQGTKPLVADTDGDGVSDGAEYAFGYDPLNASETPDLPIGPATVLGALLALAIAGSLRVRRSQ